MTMSVKVADLSDKGREVIIDVGINITNQIKVPKQLHMYVISKHATDMKTCTSKTKL